MSGTTATSHSWRSDGIGSDPVISTNLTNVSGVQPTALNNRQSSTFRFQVSDASYKWNIAITPGVQANVNVDIGIWSDDFPIGPLFFDDLAIDIGSVTFPPHAGTKGSYLRQPALYRAPQPVVSGGTVAAPNNNGGAVGGAVAPSTLVASQTNTNIATASVASSTTRVAATLPPGASPGTVPNAGNGLSGAGPAGGSGRPRSRTGRAG